MGWSQSATALAPMRAKLSKSLAGFRRFVSIGVDAGTSPVRTFRAMSDTILCPSCSTSNPVGNKFCRNCAVSLKGASWTPAPDESGFVAGGMWDRPATEFMRRVSVEAMQRETGHMKIQVPVGSVAVVVREGEIDTVLPPGKQVAVDWLDRLVNIFNDKLAKSEFYLLDVRPIPFVFPAEGRSGDGTTLHRYQIGVQLVPPRTKEALKPFIDQFGGQDSVSQQTVYNQLRPQVEALVRPFKEQMGAGTFNAGAEEQALATQLKNGVAGRMGFDVSVAILQAASHVNVDVHIGDAPAPTRKTCVSAGCGKELESSKKFCPSCGSQQPVLTSPTSGCGTCGREVPPGKKFCTGCGAPYTPRAPEATVLFTKDGQQLELDLVLRAVGDAGPLVADRIKSSVALAASKHLARFEFAQLTTASGFKELEAALLPDVQAAVQAVGLTVSEVTVLDVRSKGGQWLLKARAEMDQAKSGLMIGREWLAVEEQGLELKVLQNDLALRNQRAERDQKFNLLKEELSDERRTAAANRDHATDIREDELADRKRQQTSADDEAGLDVREAQRDANRDVGVDAAGRVRDRAVRAEDQRDTLDEASREREVSRQGQRFDREDERSAFDHDTDMARRQGAFKREDEGLQADHELAMEKKVAAHDADLSRQAMRLGSEKSRLEQDDRSYGARSAVDDDVYRTQKVGDVEEDLARKKDDRLFDDEKRREALKLDKMRAMMEMDSQIAAQDAERDARAKQQEGDLKFREEQAAREAQARLEAQQQSHTLAMEQQFQGRSAEEILAMQVGRVAGKEDGAVAAIASSFASMKESEAGGKLQREMTERLLAEKQASHDASSAQSAQTQQMMMQMMQMMQAQSAQQMAVLGNVATASVGGKREAESAREAAVQSGAAQAIGIAQQAMGNMAQVATAGAATSGVAPVYAQAPAPYAPPPAPPPAPTPVAREAEGPKAGGDACANCSSPLQPEDKVCGECGTRR